MNGLAKTKRAVRCRTLPSTTRPIPALQVKTRPRQTDELNLADNAKEGLPSPTRFARFCSMTGRREQEATTRTYLPTPTGVTNGLRADAGLGRRKEALLTMIAKERSCRAMHSVGGAAARTSIIDKYHPAREVERTGLESSRVTMIQKRTACRVRGTVMLGLCEQLIDDEVSWETRRRLYVGGLSSVLLTCWPRATCWSYGRPAFQVIASNGWRESSVDSVSRQSESFLEAPSGRPAAEKVGALGSETTRGAALDDVGSC